MLEIAGHDAPKDAHGQLCRVTHVIRAMVKEHGHDIEREADATVADAAPDSMEASSEKCIVSPPTNHAPILVRSTLLPSDTLPVARM